MSCEIASCSLPCYLSVQWFNTCLMLLVLPRRQSFCNNSTGPYIPISFIFLSIHSDTDCKTLTISRTVFLFIIHSWRISFLRGLSTLSFLTICVLKRTCGLSYYSTCDVPYQSTYSLLYSPLLVSASCADAPSLFGLGNYTGFCTLPLNRSHWFVFYHECYFFTQFLMQHFCYFIMSPQLTFSWGKSKAFVHNMSNCFVKYSTNSSQYRHLLIPNV